MTEVSARPRHAPDERIAGVELAGVVHGKSVRLAAMRPDASVGAPVGGAGDGVTLRRLPWAVVTAAMKDVRIEQFFASSGCPPKRSTTCVKFFAEANNWRQPTASAYRLMTYRMAERVGFGLLLVVENKELSGILVPPDPLEPLKDLGRRTYRARGVICERYMAHRLRSFPRSQSDVQTAELGPCGYRRSDDAQVRRPPRDRRHGRPARSGWRLAPVSRVPPVASAAFMTNVDRIPFTEELQLQARTAPVLTSTHHGDGGDSDAWNDTTRHVPAWRA